MPFTARMEDVSIIKIVAAVRKGTLCKLAGVVPVVLVDVSFNGV